MAALAALALAGCATTTGGHGPAIDVLRYHLDSPLGRGTIAVGPAAGATAGFDDRLYFDAVQRELLAQGFSLPASGAPADFTVSVQVAHQPIGSYRKPPPFSIGIGGGSYGRHGGIGGGADIPVGRGAVRTVYGTELGVFIKRHGDGSVVWEGHAKTRDASDGAAADPAARAARLASALVQGFPGESGRTITVR